MLDTRHVYDDSSYTGEDDSDVDTRCMTWSFALYLIYLTTEVFRGDYGDFKPVYIIGVISLDLKFILAVITISKPALLEESKAPAKIMGIAYLLCYPLQIYWMTETLDYCTVDDKCSDFKLEATTLFIVHLVDVFLIFWFVLREVLFCFFGICAPDQSGGEESYPLLREWQPMTQRELDALGLHTLKSGEELEYGNQCHVCLLDLQPREEYRTLSCKHSFHQECIDEWLSLNAICPQCRTTIKERQPSRPHVDQTTSLYYGAILR